MMTPIHQPHLPSDVFTTHTIRIRRVDVSRYTSYTYMMAMVCSRPKLRFRRSSYYGKVNALPLISVCPPIPSPIPPAVFPEVQSPKTEEKKEMAIVAKEVKDHRFVRVDDRLFKVPEGFFLQMPPEIRESISFSAGGGSTPEKPIFLKHHSSDQFKQILSAYNAFPSLDADSFTLDHLLTVGELSIHYRMRDLLHWFLPAFRSIVCGPHTPLRTASNALFVRMMKLAMRVRSMDLVGMMQTTWAVRMLAGSLPAVSVIFFAEMYGLRDLLGHACYAYLMGVQAKLQRGEDFNERGMLSPRQLLYIRAGYYSLQTFWNLTGRLPPRFAAGGDCTHHTQCVRIWELRWTTHRDRPCRLPEVDVLNRLGVMLELLKKDMILTTFLHERCRENALSAVAKKRDLVSRQLHHHFDV